MVIPFFGRVRRRRLLMLIAFAIFLTFYMGYSQEHADQRMSQFIPADSPEDDLKTIQKVPAKAPPPPGDDLIAGQPAADNTPKQKKPASAAGAVPASANGKLADVGPEEGKGALATDKQAEEPEDAEDEDEDEEEGVEDAEDAKDAKSAEPGSKKFVDLATKPMVPMQYGTTARPAVKGLANVVSEQRVELIVDASGEKAAAGSLVSQPAGLLRRRRFVFVGDVHGQRKSLDELLDKIDFEVGSDHLILTGDLINKGPDSSGVVQLAMELGASAVRGNHEDRVLAAYDSLRAAQLHAPKPRRAAASDDEDVEETKKQAKLATIEAEGKMERASAMLQREEDLREEDAAKSKGLLTYLGLRKDHKNEEDIVDHEKMVAELDVDPLEQNPFSHGDAVERATAATLTPEQAHWLSELPVILRLGKIAPSPAALSVAAESANAASPFNNVVVVHAGLVPELPLDRQDPYAVMVMRSLVHPSDEVRHERARAIAEKKLRAEARGRIKPTDNVNVPKNRVEAEYHRMQKMAYGPDLHHPRRPSPPGSPKNPVEGDPEPANLVLLPIEGHFRESHDRVHWAAAWNQAQHAIEALENRTTVIYGHDAITGLLVPQQPPSGLFSMFSGGGSGGSSGSVVTEADTGYTFGLDSGAVYGGKLTALIVEADKDGRVKHRLEQVACPASTKKKYAD